MKTLGMIHISWNADTNDWQYSEARVLESLREWNANPPSQGVLSLQHDLIPAVLGVLEEQLKLLVGGGWRLMSTANCMNDGTSGNGWMSPYFDTRVNPLPPDVMPTTTTTTMMPTVTPTPVAATVTAVGNGNLVNSTSSALGGREGNRMMMMMMSGGILGVGVFCVMAYLVFEMMLQ
jgi:hypothetical protein